MPPFGRNNKTTSKCWSCLKQTTSLSPLLMQLPELKRAVTCDKKSGCRLHEQKRSEFAYELHLSSQQMWQHHYIISQSTFLDQVVSAVRRMQTDTGRSELR